MIAEGRLHEHVYTVPIFDVWGKDYASWAISPPRPPSGYGAFPVVTLRGGVDGDATSVARKRRVTASLQSHHVISHRTTTSGAAAGESGSPDVQDPLQTGHRTRRGY